MPRATMSLTSSQGSDCQPARGGLTVRRNRGGPAESRHEAITRCRQGEDAQGQPARGERVSGVVYRAGRWSHLPPLFKQRALGGVEALEWASSHGA